MKKRPSPPPQTPALVVAAAASVLAVACGDGKRDIGPPPQIPPHDEPAAPAGPGDAGPEKTSPPPQIAPGK